MSTFSQLLLITTFIFARPRLETCRNIKWKAQRVTQRNKTTYQWEFVFWSYPTTDYGVRKISHRFSYVYNGRVMFPC